MTTLDSIYADQLAHLVALGATEVGITETGGGCTAIGATIGSHRFLATNGGVGMYEASDLAEGNTPDWYAGLYDEDDTQIAEGEGGEDFAESVREVLASLERGDFVAY